MVAEILREALLAGAFFYFTSWHPGSIADHCLHVGEGRHEMVRCDQGGSYAAYARSIDSEIYGPFRTRSECQTHFDGPLITFSDGTSVRGTSTNVSSGCYYVRRGL